MVQHFGATRANGPQNNKWYRRPDSMVRHFGRHAQAGRRTINGTGGRTRTGTLLKAGDFESPVSTNFTTPAQRGIPRLPDGTLLEGRDYSNRALKINDFP
jgi:hypothetical protein